MKNRFLRRLVLCVLCLMLFAATAFLAVGCGKTETPAPQDKPAAPVEPAEQSDASQKEAKHAFQFIVTKSDGTEKTFEIKTDRETVGAALLDEGLIAGDDSEFGLYVKTVDGETLDYDTDGMYWAFFVNGEYAMSGVDSTAIEEGATYSFAATKG